MKKKSCLKASMVASAILLPALTQGAITVANSGSLTPGADDVSYLPGAQEESATLTNGTPDNSFSGNNDNLTYISERPSKGQTFTTGSNAGGYLIQTISLQHVGWPNFASNGTFYSIVTGDTFGFRFGTISGNSLTPLYTGTATYSGGTVEGFGTSGTGSYFTFDLSNEGIATLAANTTYFFEVSRGNVGDLFVEFNSTAADGYVGGSAFSGDDGGSLDFDNTVALSSGGGDFSFNVGLAAVPEPSVALLGGLGLMSLLRRRRR